MCLSDMFDWNNDTIREYAHDFEAIVRWLISDTLVPSHMHSITPCLQMFVPQNKHRIFFVFSFCQMKRLSRCFITTMWAKVTILNWKHLQTLSAGCHLVTISLQRSLPPNCTQALVSNGFSASTEMLLYLFLFVWKKSQFLQKNSPFLRKSSPNFHGSRRRLYGRSRYFYKTTL